MFAALILVNRTLWRIEEVTQWLEAKVDVDDEAYNKHCGGSISCRGYADP